MEYWTSMIPLDHRCGYILRPNYKNKNQNKVEDAPAGNRTRVCTVAGYYSTTRPLVQVGRYGEKLTSGSASNASTSNFAVAASCWRTTSSADFSLVAL
ncbi:hypothetical protein ZIOFF_049791 [Zingiber officinale]|uniref:Uncharacterized protein n=1 Tax=Zingiber officinale TaxID=94328 RepID=A0A8J5FJ92_ZINOF|nr:hypothetical protein ZIOFF_049791 [Zingiber officinale]